MPLSLQLILLQLWFGKVSWKFKKFKRILSYYLDKWYLPLVGALNVPCSVDAITSFIPAENNGKLLDWAVIWRQI